MTIKVFGQKPRGSSLQRVISSPNYKDGKFHNILETRMMKDGFSVKDFWNFFTAPNTRPAAVLPSVKTDLHNLPAGKTSLVWFGHSSYLIHSNGLNILVDPVFSRHASPVPLFGKSFPGTEVYKAADMPSIDILIVTHDHYDHMDFKTIKALAPSAKLICTSLGVGSHLQYWGVPAEKILEFDWHETQLVVPGVQLTAMPARHFSGRGVTSFGTLWSSFVLELPDTRIFIGGDSGYDEQFAKIGAKYGPFDLALLECGQYNERWPYIHMMPEQTVQAAVDLGARVLMPVHWGKFALALHPWDEPVKRVTTRATALQVKVTTPRIGEPVLLHEYYPAEQWWQL
ncbi:MBL fold metallo-hydrolase [uncultured Chitinophaga sp.]|uniref:MBL fold metallo-hydrolase n=1 Tax=uncultured Chitinophaga sp. TaxID=339340 RepID=UPI0025F3FFB9|nr:MBL fold metallo-hydrolase [uncultured Chitinophaga sp.]